MIGLPSRIVFQAAIGDGPKLTYYYSKADGNAYVYCYDPLCDHTKYTCLGNPQKDHTGWFFNQTFFINNRFYAIDAYGKIYSFAFDGTDKKLEYDAGYLARVWRGPIAYGPYIYIDSKAEETPHTLAKGGGDPRRFPSAPFSGQLHGMREMVGEKRHGAVARGNGKIFRYRHGLGMRRETVWKTRRSTFG